MKSAKNCTHLFKSQNTFASLFCVCPLNASQSTSFPPAQAQKAKEELVAAHEEALEMMKTAEELLSKGEMQDAKHNFQSAYDRWVAPFVL